MLKKRYGYNDLDAKLVLKDILAHVWNSKIWYSGWKFEDSIGQVPEIFGYPARCFLCMEIEVYRKKI